MTTIEGSGYRALQITRLAKHVISKAQIAGDLEEFEVTKWLLHAAEKLMSYPSLTRKDRVSVAIRLIGAHQRFWYLRDQRDDPLLSQREVRIWQH